MVQIAKNYSFVPSEGVAIGLRGALRAPPLHPKKTATPPYVNLPANPLAQKISLGPTSGRICPTSETRLSYTVRMTSKYNERTLHLSFENKLNYEIAKDQSTRKVIGR